MPALRLASHTHPEFGKLMADFATRSAGDLMLLRGTEGEAVADPRRCPRLVFDTQEPEDLKLMSDAVPKLVGVGMRPENVETRGLGSREPVASNDTAAGRTENRRVAIVVASD